MSTNIAINGMGRIGRMVLESHYIKEDLNVVAINASYPPGNNCASNKLRYYSW